MFYIVKLESNVIKELETVKSKDLTVNKVIGLKSGSIKGYKDNTDKEEKKRKLEALKEIIKEEEEKRRDEGVLRDNVKKIRRRKPVTTMFISEEEFNRNKDKYVSRVRGISYRGNEKYYLVVKLAKLKFKRGKRVHKRHRETFKEKEVRVPGYVDNYAWNPDNKPFIRDIRKIR